ncbi:hypothetical protein Drorol1_Dr00022243 [Drosera rotundifolia]
MMALSQPHLFISGHHASHLNPPPLITRPSRRHLASVTAAYQTLPIRLVSVRFLVESEKLRAVRSPFRLLSVSRSGCRGGGERVLVSRSSGWVIGLNGDCGWVVE